MDKTKNVISFPLKHSATGIYYFEILMMTEK